MGLFQPLKPLRRYKMDDMVKVPRGTVFEFTGSMHSTISRAGVCYLGFEMSEGVVIVCKDNNSNFTTRLLAGHRSEGALVVQVKCDEGYIQEGKLYGRIDVKSRLAAQNTLVRLSTNKAREVLRKLIVEASTRVREGYVLFEVKDDKVYVNKKGKGKALGEVTLNWINSKLN